MKNRIGILGRGANATKWIGIVAYACGLSLSAAAADQDKADNELQEVVVSATKQNTTIADTGAAVNAISSDALGGGGIQSIADLTSAVPNLSVGYQFGVNRTFIRGVGLTSIDLGADGAVAFLQDEAVIARPAQQLSGFYDLARVEVLRGPQGTTYGRGATAGVVNLVTKKPSRERDGYVTATFGNYSAKTLEAAIGGPLGDRVSARIATKIEDRDGYGTNLVTGNPVDDRDAQAVRALLRFEPSDAVVVDLVADYFKEDDYNYGFHYFGPTTTTDAQIPARIFGGTTIFDNGGNLRNLWSREDSDNKRDGSSVTAIVDWKAESFNLKSITMWRDFTRFNRDDLAVTDALLWGQNNYDEESTSYSQEFTLSAERGSINWLAGLMYFDEENSGSVRVPLVNIAAVLVATPPGNCTPLTPGAPIPCGLLDSFNYLQSGAVDTKAYGAYLQGSREFGNGLTLTLGARYNNEKRTGTGSFVFGPTINVPTNKSKSWDAITPKLALEYRRDHGSLLYGMITRGFKSGVINIGSQNDVIDPEYVTSFEAGYKTKWLDGRATFSGSAFFYDYKDLQVGFVNAQSVVETVNAAKAENYGLELELQAKATERLTVDASLTWLNAEYTEFTTGFYRQNFAQVDLSGNKLSNAPEYTGYLGLTYQMPLANDSGLSLRAETSFSDDVYFTEFNNSDAFQSAYALVNASVGYESGNGWSISAWGRNLADKFVIANNIITAPLYANVRVGSLMPPRTYGLTVRYEF